LKEDPIADQLSCVFAALSDPTRRDLVARLTDRDATAGPVTAAATRSADRCTWKQRCST
jgi:hypothetical protein